MATGVLVLGIERATKLLGHLALDVKSYSATIALGAAMSTDDAEGEALTAADASDVDEDAIRSGITELTGDIEQVPSAVSAVKVAGKRAYERVRDGETVDLPPRPVTVSRLDLLSLRRQQRATDLDVLVDCSSGTYVRALARDLGAALGVGGHLAALRRTRVGTFGIAQAVSLDTLADSPELSLDLDAAVAAAFPRREVTPRLATAVGHGRRLPAFGVDGTYGVFDAGGHALALARDEGAYAKPVLVLAPAG
jgi:tRNA pseudouridine55 synthase